jgi:Post-segregation antitoxin CcdA
MASTRTTFTIDEAVVEQARRLGINISAAARAGVADAVRAALLAADQGAYQRQPERVDPVWEQLEAWGDE